MKPWIAAMCVVCVGIAGRVLGQSTFPPGQVGPITDASVQLTQTDENKQTFELYVYPAVDSGGTLGNASAAVIDQRFGLGDHTLEAYAALGPGPQVKLQTSAYHEFHAADSSTRRWFQIESEAQANAEYSDFVQWNWDLGRGPGAAAVFLYWEVSGNVTQQIDLPDDQSVFLNAYESRTTLEGRAPWFGLPGYPAVPFEAKVEQDRRMLTGDLAPDPATFYRRIGMWSTYLAPPTNLAILPFQVALRTTTKVDLFNEAAPISTKIDGTIAADFLSTATLEGVLLVDGSGQPITDVEVSLGSGRSIQLLTELPAGVIPPPPPVIHSPTAVVGSDLGAFGDTTPLENMVNQSGLAKPFVSGQTPFDAYFFDGDPAYADATYVNNWQSDYSFDLPLQGYIDLDLGADELLIDRVAIWNRSLRDVRLQLAADPAGPWRDVGDFELESRLTFPFSYTPEILVLAQPTPGRYLRVLVDSTYLLNASDPFAYAIVGEVAVSAVQVPEPATLSVAILTAALLTGRARPQKRCQEPFARAASRSPRAGDGGAA